MSANATRELELCALLTRPLLRRRRRGAFDAGWPLVVVLLLALMMLVVFSPLVACSSASSQPHEVNRAGHPESFELIGDLDAPSWAAPLEAAWPGWSRSARPQPTVIRFGYEPLIVGDRFLLEAQRISRLETEDGDTVSYVQRVREAQVRVVALSDEGGIATAEVRFERDDARVRSGNDEAREDSPVAGKAYLCHIAGDHISVEQVHPERAAVEDGRERMLVWRAVRPLVRGQLLAQALAARPQPVNKPLELSFNHLAPLVGADGHWYTESVETRLIGSTTVDEQDAAVLELTVRARVAGQGGTIQTVDLTGMVALEKGTAMVLRTEISMATHIESASLNVAIASAHTDIYGEHRVRTQTEYQRAPE